MNAENTPRIDVKYPVYYVTAVAPQNAGEAADDTVLVAIDVTLEDGIIKWHDTLKERSFIYDSITQTSEGKIIFTRLGSRLNYTLTPLSVEIFDTFVGPRIAGASLYANNNELWEELLATKMNEW